MHAFKYIAGALQRRCLKSWKSWLEVKNPILLCRQCTGVQLKWNWIHQMLSMLDIGVDSVSSLALLIIVVEYFVHAIQWKYFFSDANNACQVENGPQPQRGGRSPRKAFGSMGLPWVPRQDCPGAKDVKKCKHLRVAISNKASSGEESNGWTRTSPGFSRTDTRWRQNRAGLCCFKWETIPHWCWMLVLYVFSL